MNKVILMGRLTRDPEVRYSQGGEAPLAIARFSLAVDRRQARNNQDGQTADFINCVAFGRQGEFAERYLRKGTKIALTGRIQTGSYTNKDGVKVSDDGTAYTVSIDIGAGHTDILSVLHNGDAITVFDYDFTTGIITFTTNSFSPFEVYFKAPEIQWDGEVSVEEPANVRFDEANRIIYISGAEGFTYLDTLAAEWDSKINNFNSYYYYWDWTVELLTDVDNRRLIIEAELTDIVDKVLIIQIEQMIVHRL